MLRVPGKAGMGGEGLRSELGLRGELALGVDKGGGGELGGEVEWDAGEGGAVAGLLADGEDGGWYNKFSGLTEDPP